MTKIKVTEKIKQSYDKNQGYQEKIKPRYNKINIAEKKLKIVLKKLRFSSKVKQRYNKIEVVKNIYTLESKN